jgi:hypothetical protein
MEERLPSRAISGYASPGMALTSFGDLLQF